MEAILWIVLAAALAVGEIFSTTLFLIMFAGGAIVAAGAAAVGAPLWLQALAFVLVSALTLVMVRPAIQRRMADPDAAGVPMGVDALRGASALVVEEVDADHGMIKIDGELWRARCLEGTSTYAPGERVRVIKVSGATALVWREELPGGTPDFQP